MTRLDRRALFASGAAAALLAASGVCAQTTPRRGGSVRAGLSGALRTDTWDMRDDMGLFMMAAAQGAVFDTLTEIGADGALKGELATAWLGSPDATVWEFDLRGGVAFHNGKPFEAEDVVATFGLHRVADRVEKLGRHKVRFHLAQANTDFPFVLTDPRLVIYPAGQIEQAMLEGIGTGLYRVQKFDAGRQFIGQRVEAHYKDGVAGWFDRVEFVSIPDAAVRTRALCEGLIDAADGVDPAMRAEIAMRPDLRLIGGAAQGANIECGMAVGQTLPMDNARLAERWWSNQPTSGL